MVLTAEVTLHLLHILGILLCGSDQIVLTATQVC
jgi:hypothetical protein